MRIRSFGSILDSLNIRGYLRFIPDEAWLKYKYKANFGKPLDLENPQTYNEKLQWMKLYYRNPDCPRMVDKYTAKEYVAERLGTECIIPTLGVWDRFEDIDFDSLPNQFVLKCTHDSGGIVICRNKAELDIKAAGKKIKKRFKRNFYWHGREWAYKDIKPRIIAEQYIEDMDELVEYKLFCFDGKVKMILVCKGEAHGSGRTNDFCDVNLNRLPFTSLNPNSVGELPVPKELPELIAFAEKLSAGIPQLRVDTYLSDGKIYFGELTFYHNSGLSTIDPPEWDNILGDWFTLPEKTEV